MPTSMLFSSIPLERADRAQAGAARSTPMPRRNELFWEPLQVSDPMGMLNPFSFFCLPLYRLERLIAFSACLAARGTQVTQCWSIRWKPKSAETGWGFPGKLLLSWWKRCCLGTAGFPSHMPCMVSPGRHLATMGKPERQQSCRPQCRWELNWCRSRPLLASSYMRIKVPMSLCHSWLDFLLLIV